MKIAACLMLKNEQKCTSVLLESIVGVADGLVVYDTRSMDGTLEIVQAFCDKNGIALHVKLDEFADFSTSRNALMEFAYSLDYDFLLLLNCGDVVRHAGELKECQPEINSNGPEMKIATCMMLKNEQKRISVSLESIVGVADGLVVYDTGSTDSTLEIVRAFCDKNGIALHVKLGEFVDFSTSRNVLMEFADSLDYEFLLLLDCNDVVQHAGGLREYLRSQPEDATAWLVVQEWWSGFLNRYMNVRLLRAKSGWRYKGVVHEYLYNQTHDQFARLIVPDMILYQDRTQDDDKTGKRFGRDRDMLIAEHRKNPDDARTVFYLGQTYDCLQDRENAYRYYKKRSEMAGFEEERYQSFYKLGEITIGCLFDKSDGGFGSEWEWEHALGWYMRAFAHSSRAEPLVRIAQHYQRQNKFLVAYHFARMACELPFPTDILFIDKAIYEYFRFHVLSVVAFYCDRFEDGYRACQKALKTGGNRKIDQNNLRHYEKRMGITPESTEPATSPSE